MASLRLTPEQADFFAERIVWKAESLMEDNKDLAGPDQLLQLHEGMAPLVELGRQVSKRVVKDAESLRKIALEAIEETRESVGYAAVSLARVRAGDVTQLHWPDEKDAQAKSEANYEKEVAEMTDAGVIAQTVLEAIRDGRAEAVTV